MSDLEKSKQDGKRIRSRPDKPSEKKKRLTELQTGKYIVPILAVCLILIGTGILKFFVWSESSNWMKAGFVVILSLAFFITGVLTGRELKRFRRIMVSLSLFTLCVNILLMYMGWILIPYGTMIILVFAWCVVSALLSKKFQEPFFYIIIHVGISMISIISAVQGISRHLTLVLPLIPYLFTVLLYRREYKEGHPFFGVSFFLICLSSSGRSDVVCQTIMSITALLFAWFYEKILYSGAKIKDKFASVFLCLTALSVPVMLYHTGIHVVAASCVTLVMESFLVQKERKNLYFCVPPILIASEIITEYFGVEMAGFSAAMLFLFLVLAYTGNRASRFWFHISDILFSLITIMVCQFGDYTFWNIPLIIMNTLVIAIVWYKHMWKDGIVPLVCLCLNLYCFLSAYF